MAIIRSLYGEVISWAKTDMIDLLSKRDLPAALLRDRPGTATSGFLHILTGPVGVLEKNFSGTPRGCEALSLQALLAQLNPLPSKAGSRLFLKCDRVFARGCPHLEQCLSESPWRRAFEGDQAHAWATPPVPCLGERPPRVLESMVSNVEAVSSISAAGGQSCR